MVTAVVRSIQIGRVQSFEEEIVDAIKKTGYYILQMEGCPNNLPLGDE